MRIARSTNNGGGSGTSFAVYFFVVFRLSFVMARLNCVLAF